MRKCRFVSVNIIFKGLWTYNVNVQPKDREESEKKLPISYLNENEYTHVHGEMQIIINGKVLPSFGIDSPDDVCFGYWIEMFTKLFEVFNMCLCQYTIEGGDQGKPAYRFEKEGDCVYFSIVDSMLGGKRDPDWQRIEFSYRDLKRAFLEFKNRFIDTIRICAPQMVDYWSKKFEI